MSDKQEAIQTETGTTTYEVETPKKRGCLGHLKHFWWAYLIGFVCIAVLAICLIIFVAVPKIAQSKMNAATLEVQGVNVLRTQPNQYTMEINSTITTDGSIHADIDAFEGVMYLEDLPAHRPFVKIQFPPTTADKFQIVNVTQEVQIEDHDAFNQFNIWFFNNETLRVTIEGQTQVKPSGLARKYDVTFKKTLTMKGLNLFQGTEVTDGHIDIDVQDGPNFNGTAEIPNASYFTLDIGDASFTNFIDDAKIGTLYTKNLFLRPGVNTVPITAAMDQIRVLSAIQSPKYCATGVAPVKLQGADVVNNGQKLEYFLEALSSANQTVHMDIGSIISKSLNTTIRCRS